MKKSTKIIFLGALSVFLSACQKPADDAAIIEAAKAGYTAFQQGEYGGVGGNSGERC